MKKNEMDGTCRIYGGEGRYVQILVRRPEEFRPI
jgi:hypothetical protein